MQCSIIGGFGLLALMGGYAVASSTVCPDNDAIPPTSPRSYATVPTSDQYLVQYQVGAGPWTNAVVYISYYGETLASPYRKESGYTVGTTSMSFVSIPAQAGAAVRLRVSKLSNGPFRSGDHVSVRPSIKPVAVSTRTDGTVELATVTAGNFDGEQFILWWNRGTDGGAVEGLAFFLDPPYTEPTGTNVLKVTSWNDLASASLKNIDTLDFEGMVLLGATGNLAYPVPDRINNIFLGPGAWVQGKLNFTAKSATRQLYGPGVLDGSQFNYLNRNCLQADDVTPTDDGLYSLSSQGNGLKNFSVDGIIIVDQNHGATDPFYASSVNNVKTISWNPNNDGLRLNDSTVVSNVFVRSGDDSLMVWGANDTVTNATVWQGFNGGVVNLGWSDNSVGDYNQIDGLWVVKTDWLTPTMASWSALSQPGPPNPLNAQNNAVFSSLMVPSTVYGMVSAPVFRNIFVEDPPQVLFNLKIAPSVNCPDDECSASFLQQSSYLALKIENLYAPQSTVKNSIGFQSLPPGYIANGTDTFSYFPTGYTLQGSMNIELTNVLIKYPGGLILPLTSFDAGWLGKVSTNGADVNVQYRLGAL
jgi:hypothetical protein